MQLIQQWQVLQQLANTHPFYQSIWDYVFQGLIAPELPEEQVLTEDVYNSYWQVSTLVILDVADNKRSDFLQDLPEAVRQEVRHLFQYPEYVECFDKDYYIALTIFEDNGSGLFLLFHQCLVSAIPALAQLVEECDESLH